ncbi:MAG: TatD family hydrolase [Candidatus Daviesbacteria bacterium]
MKLIDTHAHLAWDKFQPDLDQVIDRTYQNGVRAVINIGTSIETSEAAVKLDCPEINCFSSIGLHPHETSYLTTDESIREHIDKLEKIYKDNPKKVVAVGECGLDYYFEGNSDFIPSSTSQEELKTLQKKLFQAQIDLAKKLNLPLIIHSRDSWSDIFFPTLSAVTGVFHSFTSNLEDAQKALDLGFYLSFSCMITYPKNQYLRDLIQKLPLEKILIETDSPFLPPQILRGTRNEPGNVIEVAKTIAEVKNLSLKEVSQITSQNAIKLFGLNIEEKV